MRQGSQGWILRNIKWWWQHWRASEVATLWCPCLPTIYCGGPEVLYKSGVKIRAALFMSQREFEIFRLDEFELCYS